MQSNLFQHRHILVMYKASSKGRFHPHLDPLTCHGKKKKLVVSGELGQYRIARTRACSQVKCLAGNDQGFEIIGRVNIIGYYYKGAPCPRIPVPTFRYMGRGRIVAVGRVVHRRDDGTYTARTTTVAILAICTGLACSTIGRTSTTALLANTAGGNRPQLLSREQMPAQRQSDDPYQS